MVVCCEGGPAPCGCLKRSGEPRAVITAQRTHPDRLPPDATPDARRAAIEAFRDTHTSYERLLAALGGGGGQPGGGGGDDEDE